MARTATATASAFLLALSCAVVLIAFVHRPASPFVAPPPFTSNPSEIMAVAPPEFPPPPPIPQASGPVELKLPPTEDRPHRYFVLPNGLEVIVVSDPNADKAAASMDVGVGHLSDPDNLPGCAHFW